MDSKAHNMPLVFIPVVEDRWKDLEKLFESRGGPHFCWCMVWWNMMKGKRRESKKDKKISLKDFVDRGIQVGILGFYNNEPVAWCSAAPRESFRYLNNDRSLSKVRSVVCFFINKTEITSLIFLMHWRNS